MSAGDAPVPSPSPTMSCARSASSRPSEFRVRAGPAYRSGPARNSDDDATSNLSDRSARALLRTSRYAQSARTPASATPTRARAGGAG